MNDIESKVAELMQAVDVALTSAKDYGVALTRAPGLTDGARQRFLRDRESVESAARTALESASRPPDGWVAVPVEPTQEMVEAARDVKRHRLLRSVEDVKAGREPNPLGATMACNEEWKAMLLARPEVPHDH